MSSESALSVVVGTAGAMILGYCLYFDEKRRSDPEYKRKVHERRQRDRMNELKMQMTVGHNDFDMDLGGISLLDPNNDTSLGRCFTDEMKLGHKLLSEGKLDGLSHLANAILMCPQPQQVFQKLNESLPELFLLLLVMQLEEIQRQNSSSSRDSTSGSSIKDSSATSPDIS